MNPMLLESALLAASERGRVDAGSSKPATHDGALTISQMAAKCDVTPRALRFYESKSLLSPKRHGRARTYTKQDQDHLALILKGRKLGFTLKEICQMIAAEDGQVSFQALKMTREKCLEQITLLEKQLADITEALAELRRIHASMCGVFEVRKD